MKKVFTTGWIILLIGIVVTAVGYFGHHHPFHPVNVTEQLPHHTTTTKSFTSIKATVASADITIKQGDRYQVSYYGRRQQALKVKVKDQQLILTQTPVMRAKHHVNFIWNDDERIVITVPKNHQLTTTTVKANDDIILRNLQSANAKVTSNDGDILIIKSTLNGGQLTATDGDLTVTNSQLKNIQATANDGDISLSRSTITGGQARLNSGDFTGHKLIINHYYTVNNNSGDNTVTLANKSIGAKLSNNSGDNALPHQSTTGGTISQQITASNMIILNNDSGDNAVKYN